MFANSEFEQVKRRLDQDRLKMLEERVLLLQQQRWKSHHHIRQLEAEIAKLRRRLGVSADR